MAQEDTVKSIEEKPNSEKEKVQAVFSSFGNPVTLILAVFVLVYTVPYIIYVFSNIRNIIHDEIAFLYLFRILVFILAAIGFIIAGVGFLNSYIKARKKSTDAKGEHLAKTGLTILMIYAIIYEIYLIINSYISYSSGLTSRNNEVIMDGARKLMATVNLSTLDIIFSFLGLLSARTTLLTAENSLINKPLPKRHGGIPTVVFLLIVAITKFINFIVRDYTFDFEIILETICLFGSVIAGSVLIIIYTRKLKKILPKDKK